RVQSVLLQAATGVALGTEAARDSGSAVSHGAPDGARRAQGGRDMSAVQVACPSCGAAVVFPVGTGAVAICPYCRSAVLRGDRNVEDLGKVAAIVETGAVLKLGLAGHFDGRKFQLVGRTQMKHAAGGMWDEWYAAFADGRW